MKRFLLIGFLFLAGSVFAQTNLTFYNFRTVGQSMMLNPALPSRQSFTLGIIDNYNHLYLPGITYYDVYRADETGQQTLDKIMGDSKYHLKDIQFHNEINPLFFGFRIKRSYISFGFQTTLDHNFGFPKELLSMAYAGNANPQYFGQDVPVNVQLNASAYSSIYASYTRDINEKLTIGIRAKYHIGLYNAEIVRNNTTIRTDSGTNNAYQMTLSSDYEIRGAGADRIENLTSAKSIDPMQTVKDYLSKPVGSGYSVDLGANYRVNNKLSVSASVLDLGFMNWKEAKSYSRKNTFVYEGLKTDDPTQKFDSLLGVLGDSVGKLFEPSQNPINAYKTYFNPRVYIGAQYNLYRSGSLGLVAYGEKWNNKFYPGASISFSQRIWRVMDLRVNYNIFRDQYKNVGLGMSINMGPVAFYVMTDNVLGWAPLDGTLRLNSHYTNARVGFNINFGGRYDRDNDGVPDNKDKCKKVPGLAKFDGCPDSDNDSVPDSKDECPNVKGTVLAHGCPDIDGDGVKDLADSCVNEKGSAKLNGCPDRDNDGVADKYDKCPQDSGSINRGGCPDIDGDGILDKVDQCPEIPGSLTAFGCPDADKDSVPDKTDECPNVAGPVRLKGCPDTDGDGLIDKLDSCVNEKGTAFTHGCPDSDNDSVPDKYDNCPNEYGSIENSGCPNVDIVLTVEEKKVLNEAFSNLEFKTGTAKIAESSLPSLTELAALLVVKEAYKLEINGYTDNVGNANKNKKLSEDRANAVKKFLVDNKVPATRINAQGYGSKNPVADNDTPEGRQKNRRVEFRIVK